MDAQVGNWDDLRFFLAVARHGRLSAAARELGVNHSTVFRRIAALEERLGTRLFDRHATGHRLTGAGEEMIAVAERIEDEVIGLDRQVLGRDKELRGVVRVTCASFGDAFMPHFRSFLDQHPGVDLELIIDNRFLSLHRREADIAIRPGARPTEPDLVARLVGTVRFGIYASKSYLAGAKKPRRYADLASHALVGAGDNLTQLPTALWFDKHVPDARYRLRASTVYEQFIAVRAGLGIGGLPCNLAAPDPELERLFLPDDMDTHELWLVYHGDLRQTARLRAFIRHLAAALEPISEL